MGNDLFLSVFGRKSGKARLHKGASAGLPPQAFACDRSIDSAAGTGLACAMIRQAFRRHPLLSAAFAFFAMAALVFLLRFALGALVWQPRADEPIRPWMTVGYIAHSRGLSPREIDAIAGLPLPEKGHPFTLEEIAADRGVPVSDIIAAVEAAIATLSAHRANPGPDGG